MKVLLDTFLTKALAQDDERARNRAGFAVNYFGAVAEIEGTPEAMEELRAACLRTVAKLDAALAQERRGGQ